MIVVGPVQTGKTTGFAVPAILEWQGPVVATSVKTDLLRETIAARRRSADAHVWVYDPTGGTGYRGRPAGRRSPAARLGRARSASPPGSSAARAASGSSRDAAEFWYAAAAKLLAPILFAAAVTERTMADVVRWVDSQEQEEVFDALDAADESAASTAFQASTLRDDRTRSERLHDRGDRARRVRRSGRPRLGGDVPSSEPSGFSTAASTPPTSAHRRTSSAASSRCSRRSSRRSSPPPTSGRPRRGKPLDPPLLLVLDECANIAPLRELATLASTGAGQGIQLVSVFQDMAQINAVYGRDRAPTIVSNHRAKVDPLRRSRTRTTLDYVARLLGDEEVRQVSSTSGAEGRRSTTESVAYRNLAPANVLREMRPGHGLLVYGHLPPARLALRPWFADRRLRGLAAGIRPDRALT